MPDRLDDPARRFAEGFEEPDTDGDVDAWSEPGSDELMDFSVLVQVRQLSALADAERERKIERRGE